MTRHAADPHCDALLRRPLVVGCELAPALGVASLELPLDVSVTMTRHAEVDRVELARKIEPVLLLIPCAGAAFDNLDPEARLGGLPLQRSSSTSSKSTTMIVFPDRRSVELKFATASSRVATVLMFVRSRPSRTRWTISLS